MGRDTTASSRRIELTWLRKHNYFPSGGGIHSGNLRWTQNGEPSGGINITVNTMGNFPSITFDYKSKNYWESEDEWKHMNYSFSLEKLPCRYGGFKWFFRCGLSRGGVYCGKRVRILYNVNSYYGCRMCADLTYESCNEGKRYRRGGVFGFMAKIWKAEELLEKIPRQYYRGIPTRKFRKYLKMANDYHPIAVNRALEEMDRLLGGKVKKKS